MYAMFSTARDTFEVDAAALLLRLEATYTADDDGTVLLDTELASWANKAVEWLWQQSDALVVAYANNGGRGYPTWWLQSEEVGYENGPV